MNREELNRRIDEYLWNWHQTEGNNLSDWKPGKEETGETEDDLIIIPKLINGIGDLATEYAISQLQGVKEKVHDITPGHFDIDRKSVHTVIDAAIKLLKEG